MPIGPEIPFTPTTVTPDSPLPTYPLASVQGPAVDGEIIADDVLSLWLALLNTQAWIDANFINGETPGPRIYSPATAIQIQGALMMYGSGSAFYCQGDAEFNGNVSNIGAWDWTSTTGAITITTDRLRATGTSVITAKRPHVVGATGDHAYRIADGDWIVASEPADAGPSHYDFQDTGAVDGEAIDIECQYGSSAKTIQIRTYTGSTVLCTIKIDLLTNPCIRGCTIRHNGTSWVLGRAYYW